MYYAYGVIRSHEPLTFKVEPLNGRGAVTAIVEDGLALIVSPHDNSELKPSRRNMLAHTRVLEEAMRTHDVLPMRFGMLVTNADEARRVLRDNAEAFGAALEKITGKVELSLKVWWKDGVVFREVMAENRRLAQQRDELARLDPKQSHYARIDFGKAVEAAVALKRAADAKSVLQRLELLCTDILQGETVEDTMVCNLTLLVDKSLEKMVDEAVNRIDDLLGGRFTMKYVGPIPPFSFAQLELKSGAKAA
jgi:hypothetical protein